MYAQSQKKGGGGNEYWKNKKGKGKWKNNKNENEKKEVLNKRIRRKKVIIKRNLRNAYSAIIAKDEDILQMNVPMLECLEIGIKRLSLCMTHNKSLMLMTIADAETVRLMIVSKEELDLQMAVMAEGIGKAAIRREDGTKLIVSDMLYVPQIKSNLLSLGQFVEKG